MSKDPAQTGSLDKGVSGLDGPVSRHLNRPVSRQISRTSLAANLTPDTWSYIAFASICAGATAFAAGAPRAGAVLTHLGSVLDGVDGEVARIQGSSSSAGALLDLVLDRVGDVLLLTGLAVGAGGRRADWVLALTAANGIVVSGLIKERLGAEHRSVSQLQRDESKNTGVDRLLPWTGRDGRLLAVAGAGAIRNPRLALVVIAAGANLRLARRFVAARRTLHATPTQTLGSNAGPGYDAAQ